MLTHNKVHIEVKILRLNVYVKCDIFRILFCYFCQSLMLIKMNVTHINPKLSMIIVIWNLYIAVLRQFCSRFKYRLLGKFWFYV